MYCPTCRAPNPETQSFCGQCGAGLPSAVSASEAPTAPAPLGRRELDTGTIFAGRYQIIEELGRGGMGRVYKVIDIEVRAKIALKLIRPDIAADPATIDRFRQELTTARAITHKNICRMYDLGREGDTYYLTMEYVPGEDLKSMIAMSGQLGIGTAISIAKQVCDGLGEAHHLGIVHRDLKPQNIQIDKGGHAKIMDFGIARSVVARSVTDAGRVLGTPQYMAPEQVDAKDVDARADLYALGVMLYEMLTGRVPFDGGTPLAVAMQHTLERPRDPRELNAAIPPDLDRLILKCLEKDRTQRYQTAGEVHADLLRIEQGLPTTEQVVPQQRPATSTGVTVHLTMRQLLIPALVVVALAAVSLGAWRWWPRQGPTVASPAPAGKPMLAVLYFENIPGDPTLNTWRTGVPELLITSLSQSRLLNVVSSDSLFSILTKLNLADAKRFSAEDLASVARESRAQYLLTGRVMKAGQSTVITALLQVAATGEVIRSERMECLKEEEIIAKADELARGIKADLNLSAAAIAGDISQPVGQVLTASPEALKYYTEARRFHDTLDFANAIPLFQRAIDADPGFAMAYRALSAAYGNIGDRAKADAAARRALELSGRLPERLRLLIQIRAAMVSSATYPEAIDACNTLLASYPDDVGGLNALALISRNAEDYRKAGELLEAAVKVEPTSFLYTLNLASNYRSLGQYEKATRLLETYLERDPSSVSAHQALAWTQICRGQFADAQRELDKATLLEPRNSITPLHKGDAAYLRGDFVVAEREYQSLIDQRTPADRANAAAKLALLDQTRGRFKEAREHLQASKPGITSYWLLGWQELGDGHPERAVKAFQENLANPALASDLRLRLNSMLGLGLSFVYLGDSVSARKAADDFTALREGVFVRTKTRLSLMLSGVLATTRGDGRAAVADLEQSVSMMPAQWGGFDEHAAAFGLLAQAYEVAGDLVKARETYEAITALTTGRLSWGATYARSYYRLGLIAERQGDQARAREHFAKFLELWKDADPGLPEVADAKKRMGR